MSAHAHAPSTTCCNIRCKTVRTIEGETKQVCLVQSSLLLYTVVVRKQGTKLQRITKAAIRKEHTLPLVVIDTPLGPPHTMARLTTC